MTEHFDWSDGEHLVCFGQRALAAYLNPHGQVVIRVRRDWPDEDDDPFILVNPDVAGSRLKADVAADC